MDAKCTDAVIGDSGGLVDSVPRATEYQSFRGAETVPDAVEQIGEVLLVS